MMATTLRKPDWVNFVDPTFANDNHFYFDAGLSAMNVVEVVNGTAVQYQVRAAAFGGGTAMTGWNAVIVPATTPISGAGTPRLKCGKRQKQKHSKNCPNTA
jgi:hypothetical protein